MKQILYSHGEPAGIGVDLILRIAKLKFWSSINIPIVVISDGALLKARADLLKLKIEFHDLHDLKKAKKNKIGFLLNNFNFNKPSSKISIQSDI